MPHILSDHRMGFFFGWIFAEIKRESTAGTYITKAAMPIFGPTYWKRFLIRRQAESIEVMLMLGPMNLPYRIVTISLSLNGRYPI